VTGDLTGNIIGEDPRLGLCKTMAARRSLTRCCRTVRHRSRQRILFKVDQRGFVRPFDNPNLANADDGCDIGAFEFVGGSNSWTGR
jgi:hypothetical protein